MPRGRFVSRTISTNEDLADVSLEADYLFQRMIPHLDREGRISGRPDLLKSMVCPLRAELDQDTIEGCLAELDEAELIDWYDVDNTSVVSFPNFEKHQKGLRKEREAESRYPANPNHLRKVRSRSGVDPDQVRSRSRVSEVKRSKVKRSEVKGTSNVENSDSIKSLSAMFQNAPPDPKDEDERDKRNRRFLRRYFPADPVTGKANPAVLQWMGRIPTARLDDILEEMQDTRYRVNGKDERVHWSKLDDDRRKKIVTLALNQELRR